MSEPHVATVSESTSKEITCGEDEVWAVVAGERCAG